MTETQPLYDVLGIGISAVDDTFTVDRYPDAEAKVPVLATSRHGGGLVCTATAAVATLGGRVAYMARLGDDDLSGYIRSILAQRGVDISHIINDPNGQPYHSGIIIDQTSGGRTIFYDKRHYKPVAAVDVRLEILKSARVLLLDFLDGDGPLDLILAARSAGVPVVIDMEGRSPHATALMKQVDHLVVPEEFARWASGQSDGQAACAFLAHVPRAGTVVTGGAAGCWWTDSPQRPAVHFPAFQVQAINTNGCGDTFHGAYALAIAKGFSVAEAIVFASASAALKASGTKGGWDSLPTAAQVAAFLNQRLAMDDPARKIIDRVAHMGHADA